MLILNIFCVPKHLYGLANLDNYKSIGKLTLHQLELLRKLLIAALNSNTHIDDNFFVTFESWMSMSGFDHGVRKNRNKFFYLRRELIGKKFLRQVEITDTQLEAIHEMYSLNDEYAVHLYEFSLPGGEIDKVSSGQKVVGGGNVPCPSKDVVEISGDIESTCSPTLIAKCLHRFMRTSEKDPRKIISGEMRIDPIRELSKNGAKPCRLLIKSVSLTSSSIMLNDDAVIVCYLYSRIYQRLEEQYARKGPIDSIFSFQKEEIIKHLGRKSGMGVRAALDRILDRITSTEFKLSVCDKGGWLMKSFGFVNEDGTALSSARLRLLEPVGELNEETIDGDIKSYSQIVVSLPKLLEKQVRHAIQEKERDFNYEIKWPIYRRPVEVLTARERRGIALNLLDKYRYWLGFDGAMNEFKDVNKLFHHLYHLPDRPDYKQLTQSLIRALMNSEFAVAGEGFEVTARAIRCKTLIARLDKDIIVRLKCQSDDIKNAKLSKLLFEIKAVRLTKTQIASLNKCLPNEYRSGKASPTELENRFVLHEKTLNSLLNVSQMSLPLYDCA